MSAIRVTMTIPFALAAVAALCLGQNPSTDCAAVGQHNNPDLYACVFNGCTASCEKQSWTVGAFTYTNCNCGGIYSSVCCNLAVGVDGVGNINFEASGSCDFDQGCGTGGVCGIQIGDPEHQTYVAECGGS